MFPTTTHPLIKPVTNRNNKTSVVVVVKKIPSSLSLTNMYVSVVDGVLLNEHLYTHKYICSFRRLSFALSPSHPFSWIRVCIKWKTVFVSMILGTCSRFLMCALSRIILIIISFFFIFILGPFEFCISLLLVSGVFHWECLQVGWAKPTGSVLVQRQDDGNWNLFTYIYLLIGV